MISVPSTLLRFFSEEDHALQFMSGSVRFGVLEYYRKIEDVRRDSSEGRSSVYFRLDASQPIHSTVVSLNRYYIICTAHPDVNIPSLARKYGRFVVRINSPLVLLDRIKLVWKEHVLAIRDGTFIAPVEYTKDELRDADPDLLSPPHLTYSQKPRSYEEDREYRYLIKCKIDAKREWESHLILKLPDCSDICSALTVCAESDLLVSST